MHLATQKNPLKNHLLFFNYYLSSYKLFEALKCHNIKATGTVRLDRFGMVNKKKKFTLLYIFVTIFYYNIVKTVW